MVPSPVSCSAHAVILSLRTLYTVIGFVLPFLLTNIPNYNSRMEIGLYSNCIGSPKNKYKSRWMCYYYTGVSVVVLSTRATWADRKRCRRRPIRDARNTAIEIVVANRKWQYHTTSSSLLLQSSYNLLVSNDDAMWHCFISPPLFSVSVRLDRCRNYFHLSINCLFCSFLCLLLSLLFLYYRNSVNKEFNVLCKKIIGLTDSWAAWATSQTADMIQPNHIIWLKVWRIEVSSNIPRSETPPIRPSACSISVASPLNNNKT